MNPWAFSFSPYLGLLFTFMVLVLVHLPLSLGNAAGLEKYNTCSKEFNCGNITGLTYPFWGSDRPLGCGHPDLHLYCRDDIPTVEIRSVEYRVLSFNKDSQTLGISRQDYSKGFCPPILLNTTLDPTLFDYAGVRQYITFFYGCPSYLEPPQFSKDFSCSIAGILENSYIVVEPEPQGPGPCNVSVSVPVPSKSTFEEILKSQNWDQFIEGVIAEGFEVKLKIEPTACNECLESKGVCGYDLLNQTTCFCKNKPQSSKTCSSPTAAGPSHPPSPPGNLNSVTKIAIGISAGVAGIIVVFAVICCFWRRCLSGNTSVLWKKETDDDQNIETFVKNYESLAPKRYRYSEVKKMTNSFTCKLGEGGFGCVYKGTLFDGRPVAVKRLSNSRGYGQDFINEVASISRTSHVNIVILLGFCFERRRRALIYEFMPNGSLDKFIHNRGSTMQSLNLEWTTMYRIAVGIARGLEYLYRGCNTRILHFDIKPHNILLDQDFIPKISDFGLAKLCQPQDSMVSMTQARGTAGYIAPEVFCKNFGGVSHKSDVYSYGMLVLEMVGGRKNIELQVSHTSQIYFPSWIYKQLQLSNDITALGSITNKEEEETARKMILVSMWCIQPNPSDRPSIDKVVEMLEGSSQLLRIPPNPIICSQNSP